MKPIVAIIHLSLTADTVLWLLVLLTRFSTSYIWDSAFKIKIKYACKHTIG